MKIHVNHHKSSKITRRPPILEAGIGCAMTSMPFDCHETGEEWSKEKQQWCCAAAGVAC